MEQNVLSFKVLLYCYEEIATDNILLFVLPAFFYAYIDLSF